VYLQQLQVNGVAYLAMSGKERIKRSSHEWLFDLPINI
jgi:hypothetical protein